MFRVALQGNDVQRGDTGRQAQQVVGAGEGQAGQAGHHRGAIHQRQALFGNQRQDVLVEKRLQALEQFHAHPGNPVAQRLQAGGEHGAGGLRVEQLAQAATVEGVEMTWQRLDMLQRHRDHAGVAVAGGDAIDHAFLVQQRIKKLRALGDALAIGRVVLQLRRHLTVGQGQHVFDAQREFAEGNRLKRMRRHRSSRKGRS